MRAAGEAGPVRSAHHEVVRTMVANGYGYSIRNVTPRSDLALDGRHVVRLAGRHRPMTIGLATLRSLRRTKPVTSFSRHCEARISQSCIRRLHFLRQALAITAL
ncbi:type 2 periplasmic-binding domain-containing protein [Aureimonas ureilytica]|uniref:hypothetical protein n=1 Tax=Aureimonas ureilytica TaxID=401562 RepID=UPI0003738CDB|nr:hypothetical protein [Aureimonas ureilytica]